MFCKILDDYIELYKLNGRNALDNMKNHYDCEEEYWAIIEELLDRYIDSQSKIDTVIEYYETHQQECVIGRNKDDKLIKDYYLPAQCSKKIYEFLKEDK